MFSVFFLTISAGTFIAMPLVRPVGYWAAVFRHGVGAAVTGAISAALILIFYWLRRELYSSDVIQAQSDANISPPRVVAPIVAGVAVLTAIVLVLTLMFHSNAGREATRRAQEQLGPGYHYVVTNMQIHWHGREKSVSAVVAAYNDSELKTVPVNWNE